MKKENGLLEIVLDMPTEARFLKVHSSMTNGMKTLIR